MDEVKVLNDFLCCYFGCGIAECLSVLVSGAALIFAIFVPTRIAAKQNRIALFEKRFSAYSDLLKLQSFASAIRDLSLEIESIKKIGVELEKERARRWKLIALHFGSIFNYHPQNIGSADTIQHAISEIKRVELSVNSLSLLYKLSKCKRKVMNDEITEIFNPLLEYVVELTTVGQPIEDKNRIDFINRITKFVGKYSDFFEAQMRF